MNLLIEVINGVAYVVERADTSNEACKKCFLNNNIVSCGLWCIKRHNSVLNYYRRLTSVEREELQKAIQ